MIGGLRFARESANGGETSLARPAYPSIHKLSVWSADALIREGATDTTVVDEGIHAPTYSRALFRFFWEQNMDKSSRSPAMKPFGTAGCLFLFIWLGDIHAPAHAGSPFSASIAGKVTDESGKPLGAAIVRLEQDGWDIAHTNKSLSSARTRKWVWLEVRQ